MRLTSLSRNTVRKWLKAPVLEEPTYRRSEAPGKLTPFHDAIKQALKVDAHRPRHGRRMVRAAHAQIKAGRSRQQGVCAAGTICTRRFHSENQIAMPTPNDLHAANPAADEAPKFELDFESDEPLPVCPMRQDGSGPDEACEACQ